MIAAFGLPSNMYDISMDGVGLKRPSSLNSLGVFGLFGMPLLERAACQEDDDHCLLLPSVDAFQDHILAAEDGSMVECRPSHGSVCRKRFWELGSGSVA